ncbi:serine hydrolase domain-containing protein [Algoriphagus sp. D3-2-R+10]|uniref:serine hydrolase domain-containing protein n=1 Tax=Algoriphagus aurantiacus TaxID=3103948 RepID=UPI002B3A4EF4|nr:serine hydrolase domain-containing protein [Algoriphagus sp. D3-2-R+10]MEB2778052.1 serine hydrolase domain-containing protein [Algoriphagus sp. D3-2-R+10]
MSKKIKILLAVLVFWVALFIAWEWWHSYPKVRFNPISEATSESAGIDSILHQAMSTYLLPGISVAIVKNGKVSYLNAFGYENLKTKDSLSIESKILVASVSKIFTALGVANAFLDKGINANDSLYSLGLGESFNSSTLAKIRIESLLSHQAGFRDKSFSEMIFSFSKSKKLNQWGTEFLKNPSTYHSDSIGYHYSDSNYDFLGFLLSQSENHDFPSLIQSRVLAFSGMTSSEFVSAWPAEENGITGYQKTFLWKRIEPKRIKFLILPSPSSGLITTTKDMSLALTLLMRGEMGVYEKALDWLTIDDMEVPLGFQKTQINGSDWIGHFGGQAGYSSLLFYSKEAEIGIFLFANSRDKDDFRIEIANQVIAYISR